MRPTMSIRKSGYTPSATIINYKVWEYNVREAERAGRTPPPPPSTRGALCADLVTARPARANNEG